MNIMISLSSLDMDGVAVSSIILANEFYNRGHIVFFHAMSKTFLHTKCRINTNIPVLVSNDELEINSFIRTNSIQIVHTQHPDSHKKISTIVKRNPQLIHIATTHGHYNIMGESKTKSIVYEINEFVDLWTGVATKNIDILRNAGVPEHKLLKVCNGVPNILKKDNIIIPHIMQKEIRDTSKPFIFTLSSRASISKGWEYAALVMKRLHAEGHNVRLFLIGSGEYGESLKRRFEKENYIIFCGQQNDPCNYYLYSDIAILLSNFVGESAPMTILEALSVGTPVIATDVGDIKTMITTRSGEIAGGIVPITKCPIDINAAYELCKKAIVDHDWYNSIKAAAHEKIDEVSITHIARQYELIYIDIAKRKDIPIEQVMR